MDQQIFQSPPAPPAQIPLPVLPPLTLGLERVLEAVVRPINEEESSVRSKEFEEMASKIEDCTTGEWEYELKRLHKAAQLEIKDIVQERLDMNEKHKQEW